jgi:hypothetical protein
LGLPVDWRISRDALADYGDGAAAWARRPGYAPGEITSLSDWIGPWTRDVTTNGAITTALVLIPVALLLPLLFRTAADRLDRKERALPSLVVLVPTLVALVAWFIAAPAVRFAFGWIWLLPLGLLAWFVPSSGDASAIAVKAVVAALLAVGVAHAVGTSPYRLVTADGSGPFGSIDPPVGDVHPFMTDIGRELFAPVVGDQCWSILWCAPSVNTSIEPRGADLADGFRSSR